MDTFCFTMSLFSTTKHTIQTLVNVLRYDRHTNSLVSQEDLIKARHMEDIELYCFFFFRFFLVVKTISEITIHKRSLDAQKNVTKFYSSPKL